LAETGGSDGGRQRTGGGELGCGFDDPTDQQGEGYTWRSIGTFGGSIQVSIMRLHGYVLAVLGMHRESFQRLDRMAHPASTTQLDDRRREELSLGEVERIRV
jgi:hypothetical protein